MQQQGQALLKKLGFIQYEVSAYAQNNNFCRHNINYWEFGDYLGIGAGAHGKITMPDGSITRHTKYRHPEKYMEMALGDSARSSEKRLVKADLGFEFMLNTTRLKQGFTKELFEARTLLPLSTIEPTLKQLIEEDLMKKDQNLYKTTPKGWLFVNDIVNRFI
jgi:oxygen-independent coproporphyrinogen-3 oxidase